MTDRSVYKITPACFANVWGGNKLRNYGKELESDRIGESWELSFVKGGEATVGGIAMTEKFPRECWGKRAQGFEFFPVLTKFIDAREKLSVQVHPSDDYALKNEGTYGKTEMWYVVEADEGAGLYMGFCDSYSEDELRRAIKDGTVEKMLRFVTVRPGDVFFIPAGTVHAIGGGVLIYEIQQNSTLTYRLYDYGRLGTDGQPRELHVEKALKVLKREPYVQPTPENDKISATIGTCEYFTVKKYDVSSSVGLTVNSESFLAISATKGRGVLSYTDNQGNLITEEVRAGDTFFAPACHEPFTVTVSGDITVITTEVGE